MAVEITRQELYDLVWKEPMKNVAPRLGRTAATPKRAFTRSLKSFVYVASSVTLELWLIRPPGPTAS